MPPLSLDELARSTGQPRPLLRTVLGAGVARGRVRADDGRYAIIEDTFPAGVLDALRELSRP